jgi:hypothetical protein
MVAAEILKTVAADHVKILALTVKNLLKIDALAQSPNSTALW